MIKPFFIYDYKSRKNIIEEEKNKLKLGSEHFDAANYLLHLDNIETENDNLKAAINQDIKNADSESHP